MTKEEVIKEAYEEAGFIWNEINSMVDMYDGTFKIKDPSIKSTLTGYSKACLNNLIKAISLTDKGELWIQLCSLNGLVYNNGWVNIESDDDLPKDTEDNYIYNFITSKGKMIIGYYNRRLNFICKYGTEQGIYGITHYQHIIKPKPPIY